MASRQRIHWKRFSLRTLFILMTICCLVFGTWAAYVNPYRLEARSLAEVKRLQGEFELVRAEGPEWHRWLVTTLLGDDAFVHVTKVDLNGRDVDDNALRALAGLVHLQFLSLDYTQVTDDGIAVLRSMPHLRHLSLRYTAVSDRGAAQLAALPSLNTIHLTGTKLSDESIDALARHGGLSALYIRWTQISDSAAARLAAALPGCSVHHHALLDQTSPP
jgi:hypothetical protein